MQLHPDAAADANFVEVERQFIRDKAYLDFEWVRNKRPTPINRLKKPLFELRVALVTTCGAHLKTDRPFNLASPVGDDSYREIPRAAKLEDLALSHVGYDVHRVSADKNCVLPLDRLADAEREGRIGSISKRHFSFMGYIPVTARLINESAPDVAEKLKADEVDLVVLAPA